MYWIAHRLQQSMRRHEAAEAILKTGARLRFDFEIDQSGNRLPEPSLPGPTWLQYWTGDDLGANVVEADVQTDIALERIKDLPQLHQRKRPAEHVEKNRSLGVVLASGEIRPDASGGGGG
jgi:hypothetical protein